MGTYAPAQSQTARVPRWAWLLLAAAFILKLVLVSHDEVLSYGTDTGQYVRAAASWYWGQPFGVRTYVRLPVYPLFLASCSALGVPARLAIECVWGMACVGVLVAIRRCGLPAVGGVIAALLAMFHPWTITVFFRLFADTLYAPVFVLFVCATLIAVLARTGRGMWRWGAVAAIACGLAANTRPESVVLVPVLLAGGIGVLIRARAERAPLRQTFARLGASVLLPLVVWQALTQAICYANLSTIGVYATCDMTTAGFRSLYDALLAIPPEHSNPRLPIQHDVRARAYAASPTFAMLRQGLEDPAVNRIAAVETGVLTQQVGDRGADASWAIRDAAWIMRQDWTSAGELDAFYAQATAELRAAMTRGELGRRAVPLSFIPPEWGAILTVELPRAVGRVANELLRPRSGPAPTDARTPTRPVFDAVAVRRNAPGEIRLGNADAQVGWYAPRVSRALDRWKSRLDHVYRAVSIVSLTLLAAGFVLAPFALRRGWITWRWFVASGILWAGCLSRLGLVTLLDTTGVPLQVRYMLGAVGLLAGLVVLHGAVVAGVISGLVRAGSGGPPTPRS